MQILNRVLQSSVSRREAYFMKKTFCQLGGLQFDRDIIRLPLSHFSEIYQISVRERLARLTQMATILCFESVEEMLDYREIKERASTGDRVQSKSKPF